MEDSKDLIKRSFSCGQENDTISRQAAIVAVKCGALSAAMVYGRTDAGSTALFETVKAIKALPSAQPEIVRCKDCKYYLHDEEYGFDWCNRMSGVFRVEPDGFCSWADMRGGEME